VSVLIAGNVSAQWSGAGTLTSPYQINNNNELIALANSVNGGNGYSGKYFILLQDLDFTGVTDFIPIGGWSQNGLSSNSYSTFQGEFNGNGKIISNLSILKDSNLGINKYIGLFGRIYSGVVKNLGLVYSRTRGYEYVGTICGELSSGTIENCFSTGLVVGSSLVGGFVGNSDHAVIKNCYTTADVSGITYVGGFAGALVYANTQYSYSSGNVRGFNYVCPFSHATWGTHLYQYSTLESVIQGSLGNNPTNILTPIQMSDGTLATLLNTNQIPSVFCHDTLNVNQGYPVFIWHYNQLISGVFSQPATEIYAHSTRLNARAVLYNDTLVSKGFLWKDASETNYDTVFISGDNNAMSYLLSNLSSNTEYVYRAFINTTSISAQTEEVSFHTMSYLGQGTFESPFEITDTTDLIFLSNYVNSKRTTQGVYYKLMNNIDMAGVNNFIPIGSWNIGGTTNDGNTSFLGRFDGNYKKILNLTIIKDSILSTNTSIGLFGKIGQGAEIRNLGLENSRIRGYEQIGSICGVLENGIITNCYTKGGLISGTNYIGGICGENKGIINNSYSNITVRGTSFVGGFAGALSNATTKNSYSSGDVYGLNNVCGFAHGDAGTTSYLYYRSGSIKAGYNSIGIEKGVSKTITEMYNISFVNLLSSGIDSIVFKADFGLINDSLPLLEWQYVKPIITKPANNITEITARITARITDLNMVYDSVGFYCKAINSSQWISLQGNYIGGNTINYNLTGLNPNTDYQFMAYIAIDQTVFFSDTLSFLTLPKPISISTDSAQYLSASSVNLFASLDIGSYTIIRKGFEFKLRSSNIYTVYNITDTSAAFEKSINGLLSNTYYTFRAFVESEQGIQYGSNIDFVILGVGLSSIDQIIQSNLYPNPTTNQAKLQLSGVNTEIKLMIIDIKGRIVKTQTLRPSNNNIETIIDLSYLPKGIYYIKLEGENLNRTEKLIKM